jgi:DNA-directed RNA polymerases I and III subunit RPAC1
LISWVSFRNGFDLNVLEQNGDELIFEMIGCDFSFANALRRILLAEVPTVALETVYMMNNTSLIHDEVLSHRLGLVPLNVDARLFEELEDGVDDKTDSNTVIFRLKVKCSHKAPSGTKDSSKKGKKKGPTEATASDDADGGDVNDGSSPNQSSHAELDRIAAAAAKLTQEAIDTPDRPYTLHVYSGDLEWLPQGNQQELFADVGGIRPVHEDILLAKLRPGQEIELEAYGHVGNGKDHAKFSPVATACYRLATEVELLEPVYDELAEELVHLYEPGVFELVPSNTKNHRVMAKVCNPYACTMSRNYMRNPDLARAVQMRRIPNHFIFSVESVGMQKPAVLVADALRILQQKCFAMIDLTREQEDS